MSAREQSDQGNRRRKRAPKVKSKRGRGGDHTSLAFQREQSRIDGEIYKLVCEGFFLSQAASSLGISEERAGVGYRRAINSLRLATIEEAKGAALTRIRRRRSILFAEIEKRVRMVGGDAAKLIDSGDLRALFDAANQLDVRESRLMGLDAPLKSLIGWVGVAPSEDLLTVQQLDRLSLDQLRQLFELLEIARSGKNGAVEVESRAIATNGHAEAPATTAPVEQPAQPPAPVAAPIQPAPASRPGMG